MYYVTKEFEISACHSLSELPYESKCKNVHGHNWKIKVYLASDRLNHEGMIMDFVHIKNKITDKLDHKNLDEVLDFPSTAENMSKWISEQFIDCYRVDVQEAAGSWAVYIDDAFKGVQI